MKRTQLLELLCNIKATWVSFVSIVMFVALGIGLYSGLCWTGEDIKNVTDNAFKQGNLHAFEMAFPYGFTDDDIQAIRNVEGVDDVDPGYASGQTLELGEKTYAASVRSLTEHVDVLTVDKGTLPTKNDEIALNTLFAQEHGISVGDTVSFARDGEDGNSDGMKYLVNGDFKVTALVTSPAYQAKNSRYFGVSASGGSIDVLSYVAEGAFNRSAFNDAYVTLEVSAGELSGLNVYSSEYAAKSNEIKQRIEALGQTRADQRYREIIAQAQAKIDDGEAKLADARKQIDDGTQKLADAQDQVNQNTRKLEDVQLELDVTLRMLNNQDSMASDALMQVSEQIASAQRKMQEAQAQASESVARVGVLESEANAISRFSTSSRASFNKLNSRFDELKQQRDAGEIDSDTYDDQLDAACTEFRTEIAASGDELKRDAPDLYEKNSNVIDGVLSSCSYVTPLSVELALPQLSRSFELVDGVASMATTSAETARQAADDATAQMNEAQRSLDEATALYAKRKAEYDAQISQARGQVASGQAQVDSGKEQLSDAQSEIDSKRGELTSAQNEYDQGKQQLQDAKDAVSQTVSMSWIITPAYYNGSIQAIAEMTGVLSNLRFSMASLFVIVGLLVCYSAVSRIVHEQITQVGTKKAIGFTNREITCSYLLYTGIAVLIGAALGIAVGMAVVEPLIIPTMNQTMVPDPLPMFGLTDFLSVAVVDLVLILASTWFACRGVLKRDAVELLQGERPPSNRTRFYERWRLWRRLGLFTQTVVNNCVNDKRRVIGTLVGVAGCTALIVSAVTLNNNVNDSFNKQLTEVCTYDAVVYCNPDENTAADGEAAGDSAANAGSAVAGVSDANAIGVTAAEEDTGVGAEGSSVNGSDALSAAAASKAGESVATTTSTSGKPSVNEYLTEQGLSHAAVQKKSFALDKPDGTQGFVTVYTPANPDAFNELFHLKTFARNAGTGVLDGAWVCSSYANYFGAKVGDIIEIENAAGQKFQIPIAGFFEYYSATSAIVLSESAYERIMGSDVVYNAYLVDARDRDASAFQANLAECTSDFASYSNEAQSTKSISTMFNRLSSTMVGIYIALSALMAVIVLLNLSVMFIDEKKRELIVLMINGYSQRDAKRYIYRDTIVITAVGILLGCALGCAMGYLSVSSLENSTLCMMKTPNVWACLIGAGLCAVFSAAITAISLRRIDKFDLTDINRF